MTTITIPIDVAEAAAEALGNFVSDHGWSDSDMQAMDNLDSYIARHKAIRAELAKPDRPIKDSWHFERLDRLLSLCLSEPVYSDYLDSLKRVAGFSAELAKPVERAEPAAWRTFDGEGGYMFRAYEDNEDYQEWWEKRNPRHRGWVEPLYLHPPTPAWHDAPTEPGLWFNSINHYADIVSQHWIDRGVVANSHARWYGPIPQDTKAEGESA